MQQQKYHVLLCDSLPFWGGGEHWMVVVARALAAQGWQITIAGREGAEILTRARLAGVSTVAWSYRRDFDIRTIVAASRYLRTYRPDVVVITTGRDIRTVGLVARWRKIPVLWRMGLKPKHTWVHRVTGQWVVGSVIAPSEYVGNDLEQFPWLRGKTTVIPNGIVPIEPLTAERIAAARAALNWQPDERVILYAGRLLMVKGVDLLIRAFAALAPQFPTARLVLVGDGADGDRFRRLASETGAAGRVDFCGYTTDPSTYFDACDVFALASRSETFGFVLLEAMIRGKPVVATRVGAVPEVTTGDSVLLVPQDDPRAIAEALTALLNDPRRRSALGERGRRRVAEQFSEERMVERTARLLEQVISNSRRG
jgi:glycosyltransferase involved in cell wall biosynthesis